MPTSEIGIHRCSVGRYEQINGHSTDQGPGEHDQREEQDAESTHRPSRPRHEEHPHGTADEQPRLVGDGREGPDAVGVSGRLRQNDQQQGGQAHDEVDQGRNQRSAG